MGENVFFYYYYLLYILYDFFCASCRQMYTQRTYCIYTFHEIYFIEYYVPIHFHFCFVELKLCVCFLQFTFCNLKTTLTIAAAAECYIIGTYICRASGRGSIVQSIGVKSCTSKHNITGYKTIQCDTTEYRRTVY